MGRGLKLSIAAHDILDWESFHNVFADKLGFPDFYGRNMNAWVDCILSIRNPEHGMTNVHLTDGVLSIYIEDAKFLCEEAPEILKALDDCCAFINYNCVLVGEEPIVALSYYIS